MEKIDNNTIKIDSNCIYDMRMHDKNYIMLSCVSPNYYDSSTKLVLKNRIYVTYWDTYTSTMLKGDTFYEGAITSNITFVPEVKDGKTFVGWYTKDGHLNNF